MRATIQTVASVLAGCLLTGGCGSGGNATPAPPTTTKVLSGIAALDGLARSDGFASGATSGIVVGDFDPNPAGVAIRGLVTFDLSGLPAGATVDSATLLVFQYDVFGTPYVSHGVVVVDHVDAGAALDAGDFAGGTLTSDLGTLSTDAVLEYKALEVGGAVAADRAAARTTVQFRLRFSLVEANDDGNDDAAFFDDTEDSGFVNSPPLLVVRYRP